VAERIIIGERADVRFVYLGSARAGSPNGFGRGDLMPADRRDSRFVTSAPPVADALVGRGAGRAALPADSGQPRRGQ
jgi:hypothetical protein